MSDRMNYLDLFSGAGGFHRGLEEAGVQFDNCFHSEVDKYACQVYHKHFPESRCLGDISNIHKEVLTGSKPIDIITAGFPCQDLSIAGKKVGLKGKRSGLFYEATRLIREFRPKLFILENVKGLFSLNQGYDFLAVLEEIADIGAYDLEWELINTSRVLPQSRERIYFVGYPAKGSRPQIFPLGEGRQKITEDSRQREVGLRNAVGIDANYYKGADGKRTMIQVGHIGEHNSISQRVYSTGGISRSITGQGGGQGAKTGLYETGTRIRRLTPLETERLQGFQDNWTATGIDKNGKAVSISDTQRYKMMGNAVSVPVVKAIGERLI